VNIGIAFAPLVGTPILWAVIAAAALLALVLFVSRSRGAAVRTLALALIALALANPSFTREDREPLTSVVAVVVDKSPSQNFGTRTKETAQAQEALVDALKKKQYSAFSNNPPGDKLFHVQIGPFADVKDAEITRGKLISDGYNPILKK